MQDLIARTDATANATVAPRQNASGVVSAFR